MQRHRLRIFLSYEAVSRDEHGGDGEDESASEESSDDDVDSNIPKLPKPPSTNKVLVDGNIPEEGSAKAFIRVRAIFF